MVMELLEGKSLKTILQEEKTISNQLVAAIAREICDALSAVHDKGIVHRDLKPANIIIINSNIENAELKLIDFGHLIT
jgi:serine/threonine-protein kinase